MLALRAEQNSFATLDISRINLYGGTCEFIKIGGAATYIRRGKWLECVESPKTRGAVFRGETRYWINAGIYDKAVEAADRMQEAYPEYAIRACRLRALAYASAGELALARVEISKARSHSLPCGERLELLYLEAWISLQDNDIELAERNLRTILKEAPNGNMNRKARHVLDSLEGNR